MDKALKIKELRQKTGMNRKEFCEYFHIPYRTVTEWERDGRHAPEYLIRLLEYYIRVEDIQKDSINGKGKSETITSSFLSQESRDEIKRFQRENESLYKILNKDMKKYFFEHFDINTLAKAMTHYCFRNGPVEDMHAEGKLGQEDMKTLNKYMVDRLGTLLSLVMDEEWAKLSCLHDAYAKYGHDWDDANIDYGEADWICKHQIESLKEELEKD